MGDNELKLSGTLILYQLGCPDVHYEIRVPTCAENSADSKRNTFIFTRQKASFAITTLLEWSLMDASTMLGWFDYRKADRYVQSDDQQLWAQLVEDTRRARQSKLDEIQKMIAENGEE